MGKRSVDVLIDQETVPRGVLRGVSSEIVEEIELDLLRIEEVRATGKPVPSCRRIAKYLREEYGVTVGRTSIGDWLRKIRTEGHL